MLRPQSYQITRDSQSLDLDRESRAADLADALCRAVRRGRCDLARQLDAELAMLGYGVRTYDLARSAIGGGW